MRAVRLPALAQALPAGEEPAVIFPVPPHPGSPGSDGGVMKYGKTPDLSSRPLFIVWRAASGVPPGWMPPHLEGRWDYRPAEPPTTLLTDHGEPRAIAIRTDRIEHRESDGASAEVWEVHPVDGNYDPDPANRLPLW